MKSFTVRSNIGMLTKYLITGLISDSPRRIARIVRIRSNEARKTKDTFSAVHLLNVAEEPHQLVTIPVHNRPLP
jgi:ribosomal protein S26